MSSIKILHITTVAISYFLFVLRGVGRYRQLAWIKHRWLKILPHLNDTVLLLTGVSMVFVHSISFSNAVWLHAKLIALVIYIFLGLYALKGAHPTLKNWVAWILAQLVFVYIVFVAITKNIEGPLVLL